MAAAEKQTDSPSRGEFIIQGIPFTIDYPFKEGHVCNGNEADVLNQTRVENCRNNKRTAIDEIKLKTGYVDEEGNVVKPKAIDEVKKQGQALIDEYLKDYEFGVRRGGGGFRSKDPVQAAAEDIAIQIVKRGVKAKGISLKDLGMPRLREMAKELIEKNPKIMARAKKQVEEDQALFDEVSPADVPV